MKVKVNYEKKSFHSAEVTVKDEDFLEYVQQAGSECETLDELRADDGEDLEYLLREYLEEVVFYEDAQLVGVPVYPGGPTQYEVDSVEEA